MAVPRCQTSLLGIDTAKSMYLVTGLDVLSLLLNPACKSCRQHPGCWHNRHTSSPGSKQGNTFWLPWLLLGMQVQHLLVLVACVLLTIDHTS